MKRLVLAGVLAVAALLGSQSKAEAIGWGRDGIAFSFGLRISYWYDGGHHDPCYGPACYAPPVVGGATPYLADHSWAYSGPFTTPGTFAGYGSYGTHSGYPVSTGNYGPTGTMVGHNYGYGYGSGYGYAY